MRAIYLSSNDAQRLALDVDGALQNGYDLQGGLVAAGREIGQWVVKAPALYDYRLVSASSTEILEALVNGYIDDGWDFYRDTLLWDGNYLQWIMRENQAHALFGQKLREALDVPVNSEQLSVSGEALTMVVDARPILRLAPMAHGASMVMIPYPVNFS